MNLFLKTSMLLIELLARRNVMPAKAMAQILYSIKKHVLAFHWFSADYFVHQANNLIQESHATA